MKKVLTIILMLSMAFYIMNFLCGCGKNETCEHSYGNWNVVADATCTQNGLKERTCSKCHNKESVSIPSVGHNFVNGICTDCGIIE